jgi:hypothetical protein
VFKSEADIDAYLSGRFLKSTKGDVCLADYCDVLQCDEYYESLETSSSSSTSSGEKDYAAKTRAGAHCYALTKTCFPERSESAVQEKNARRFESIFCDTFVGLHQDGRNAFAHIRKQHQRGHVRNANTNIDASASSSSSSSSSSFLIVSTLFTFLGFIFYLLFVLAPSINRRASGSDLKARKGRRTASKKKSTKDVAFDFFNRALILSGFKPKKKRY